MARGSKADIVEDIAYKIGLQKTEVRDIFDIIITLIKETLTDGESIKIPNFGTFSVRTKRARSGRNPKTGQGIEIAPRRVVAFHRCSKLAQSVNNAEAVINEISKVGVTSERKRPHRKHDWPSLWAEYQEMKTQNPDMTDTEFGRLHGISKTLLSARLKQFKQALKTIPRDRDG
ncbi:MAG: integration host factor subunit alpha [Nitrospirota bacterium]